jgi:hypothetical protein
METLTKILMLIFLLYLSYKAMRVIKRTMYLGEDLGHVLRSEFDEPSR